MKEFSLSITIAVILCSVLFADSPSFIRISDSMEFSSSNLPIIIIDTAGKEIPDAPRIAAHMGIIFNGTGYRNRITDSFNDYDGPITIELRGSSSLHFPKQQYRFETKDSEGSDKNVSLLGLPRENDWVFHGPYDDQSQMRNVLAFKLSNQIGRYAPRTRFCELVLNGNYRGIYVLMEKIKRDKNRVDIDKMTETDISGSALTGGYIIKIDKFSGENIGYWHSKLGTVYQYHYPKADDLLIEQARYIQNHINEFESLVCSDDVNLNHLPAIEKYLDTDALVDHFLINEFCKNVDAYRISTYMYKDRDYKGGKLTLGPIWDFNLSFGKTWWSWDMYRTDGWQLNYNEEYPDDTFQVPFWWNKLVNSPEISNKIYNRWNELKENIFNVSHIHSLIDTYTDTLSDALVRNFERWPETAKTHSYETEIQYMKQWATDRFDWIDKNIIKLISVNITDTKLPSKFMLHQNYPNPFNLSTTLRYFISKPGFISLKIISIHGREILTIENKYKTVGSYSVTWNGLDSYGQRVSSGVYLCRLAFQEQMITQKMVLVK